MVGVTMENDFYEGRGFSKLSGPGASDVEDYWSEQEHLHSRMFSAVGNLFRPVVTAEFEGAPTDLPVNWLLLPDRGMDYCLINIQPGYGFPEHVHGYGTEFYLVVSGSGCVRLGGKLHDAGTHDVFHISPGMPHEVFNPVDSTEPFRVFAVNSPAIRHTLRSSYWSHPTGRPPYSPEPKA